MKKVMSGLRYEKFIFLVSMALMLVAAQAWGATLADYDGNYAGSYSGNDKGVWIALHDDANELHGFLMFSTDDNVADFGGLEDLGEKDGVREFGVETEIYGTGIDSFFTLDTGSVTGTWLNKETEENGKITGELVTAIPFAGTYSGTFTGDTPPEEDIKEIKKISAESSDITGTWEMIVANDGVISGTATASSAYGTETITIVGGAHPDGYIIAVGLAKEEEDEEPVAIFYGTVADRTASGSWLGEGGSIGTFTGTLETSSSGTNCFIGSVLK